MSGTLKAEVFDKDAAEPFKNPLDVIDNAAAKAQKGADTAKKAAVEVSEKPRASQSARLATIVSARSARRRRRKPRKRPLPQPLRPQRWIRSSRSLQVGRRGRR